MDTFIFKYRNIAATKITLIVKLGSERVQKFHRVLKCLSISFQLLYSQIYLYLCLLAPLFAFTVLL